MTKKYRDGNWLRRKYIGEGLSHKEIALLCGVSDVTVSNWCAKFGIKKRNPRLSSANRLDTNYPELAQEWSEDNELDPSEVCAGSGKKVKWVCSQGHKWEATVGNRTNLKSGCPYCKGNKVSDNNRLTEVAPHLINEWSSRNEKSPKTYSFGTTHKAWWECSQCAYEWKAFLYNRTIHGKGCPECAKSYDGWEVAYAEHLDRQGVSYIHHPDPLNTPLGQYFPDFLLPLESKYLEIKGRYWERKKQTAKIEWLRDGGTLIEILYGGDLRDLGII